MTKSSLSWFDLKNYDWTKYLSPSEWAFEIRKRRLIAFLLFEKLNQSDENDKSSYKWALESLEDIKKFGLFTSPSYKRIDSDRTIDMSLKNRYVKNISVLEAFSFLYQSDRKEEFIKESDYVCNLSLKSVGRVEFDNCWKNYEQKYGHSLSEEFLDDQKRFYSEKKLENSVADEGFRFLKVDLYTSDEILLKEFKSWLSAERQIFEFKYPKKSFSKLDFLDWSKNQLLGYWDITTVCKFEHINITNDAIGNVLFPDEIDVTISERVRKVLKPKISKLFTDETEYVLESQETPE